MKRVLQRDHFICYVCGQPGADQMDHVIPVKPGGADTDANCKAIHRRPCHATKSAREGAKARWAKTGTRRRPEEPHPGLTR